MKTMNVIASNTEENVVPNRILIFSPQTAAILLNEKIGWGRFDFPRNKTEQGGWMIGHHITNGQGEIIKSEVQYILEAETDVREPGYIEWSALEDIRLQRAFSLFKEVLQRLILKQLSILNFLDGGIRIPIGFMSFLVVLIEQQFKASLISLDTILLS